MAEAVAPTTLAVVVLYVAAAFFATAHAKTNADGDLIAKTCANATSPGRSMFLPEEFCNSRLRMDKQSAAAAKNPRDLALIAMNLTQRAVAGADAKVDGLLRSGAGHYDYCTVRSLRRCRVDYAAVASSIPVCRAMVEDYKKPAGAGANHKKPLAPSDYLECSHRLRRNTLKCMKRAFWDGDLSELSYSEAGEAWQRTLLVEAMLEEMLGVVSDGHGDFENETSLESAFTSYLVDHINSKAT